MSLCLVWLAPAPSPLAGLPVTHRKLAGSPTTHHLFPVSADSSSWSNMLRVLTFSASWGNHPLHAAITHPVEAVSLRFLSALSQSPFASRGLKANGRHLEWPLKMAIPKETSLFLFLANKYHLFCAFPSLFFTPQQGKRVFICL